MVTLTKRDAVYSCSRAWDGQLYCYRWKRVLRIIKTNTFATPPPPPLPTLVLYCYKSRVRVHTLLHWIDLSLTSNSYKFHSLSLLITISKERERERLTYQYNCVLSLLFRCTLALIKMENCCLSVCKIWAVFWRFCDSDRFTVHHVVPQNILWADKYLQIIYRNTLPSNPDKTHNDYVI